MMLLRVENQLNPAFEANLPNWPDVFIDGKKSTMLTKTFFNLPELTQIADLDLLILSIGEDVKLEGTALDVLLKRINANDLIFLLKNNTSQNQLGNTTKQHGTYIKHDADPLTALFNLGRVVAKLFSEQLIATDYQDFIDMMHISGYGTMYMAPMKSESHYYLALSQELLGLVLSDPKHQQVVGLYHSVDLLGQPFNYSYYYETLNLFKNELSNTLDNFYQIFSLANTKKSDTTSPYILIAMQSI